MAPEAAAIFRLEGALSKRGTLACPAYFAGAAQDLPERLGGLGAVALAFGWRNGPGKDATGSLRLAWAACRGMSEDRVHFLGEEFAEQVIDEGVRPVADELLTRARREGFKVLLVSDWLDTAVKPIAEHLRVDGWYANKMEIRGGRATGRLLDPVISTVGPAFLDHLAETHAVDLARSRAYGSAGPDALLLSGVGWPCTVHPERDLRQVARDQRWPVVEA